MAILSLKGAPRGARSGVAAATLERTPLVLGVLLLSLLLVPPGGTQAAEPLDESTLRNVDAQVTITLTPLGPSRPTRTYVTSVRVRNVSAETLPAPLYLVVSDISPPGATVVGADGITRDGRPYYDLTAYFPRNSLRLAEKVLSPGASTSPLRVQVQNAGSKRVALELHVLATTPPASVRTGDGVGLVLAEVEGVGFQPTSEATARILGLDISGPVVNGSFSLTGIPPGTHVLCVAQLAREPACQRLTLGPGVNLVLSEDIRLPIAGTPLALTAQRLDYASIDFAAMVWERYFERSLPLDLVVEFWVPDRVVPDPYNPNRLLVPAVSISPAHIERYDPVFFTEPYSPERHLNGFIGYFTASATSKPPEPMLASYLSGADCHYLNTEENADFRRDQHWRHPTFRVSCEPFEDNELLCKTFDNEARFRVDIRNPAARQKFIGLIVDEALARGFPTLYLDNIDPRFACDSDPTKTLGWDDVLGFLADLRGRLAIEGIRLLVNIAEEPGVFAPADYETVHQRMADATDGFMFEVPFHTKYVAPCLHKVKNAMDTYRRWLDRNKLVMLNPVLPDAEQAAHFAAALAMALREPGDPIRVLRRLGLPEARNVFPWTEWPVALGAPVAGVDGVDGVDVETLSQDWRSGLWSIRRELERATLTIHHRTTSADTVTVDAIGQPVPVVAFKHGQATLAEGILRYDPDLDDDGIPDFLGADVAIFRQDPLEPGGKTQWTVVNVLTAWDETLCGGTTW